MFLRFQQIYTAILQTSTNNKMCKNMSSSCTPRQAQGELARGWPPTAGAKSILEFCSSHPLVDHGQLPSLSPNNSSWYSCSIQESTSVPVG